MVDVQWIIIDILSKFGMQIYFRLLKGVYRIEIA